MGECAKPVHGSVGAGRALRILLALALAILLVPALGAQRAVAAASEPVYYGYVYDAQAKDEHGYPLFTEDGTPVTYRLADVSCAENLPENVVVGDRMTVTHVTYDMGEMVKGETYEDVLVQSFRLDQRSEASHVKSVDASACPNLVSLYLDGMGNLASVSLNSELKNLGVQGCGSFKGVDVSGCTDLRSLSLDRCGFTELDVNSIPQTVTLFNCTYNKISDTGALVERFGESAVLPQASDSLVVLSEEVANGYFVAGQEQVIIPSLRFANSVESSNFSREDREAAYAAKNFTVASSDESVVTAEVFTPEAVPGLSSSSAAAIRYSFKKAGDAVISATYDFPGKFGHYQAKSTVKVTVAAKANKVTGLSVDPADLTIDYVEKCPVCGQPHSGTGTATVTYATENPDLPKTGGYGEWVEKDHDSLDCTTSANGINKMDYTFWAHAAGVYPVTFRVMENETPNSFETSMSVSTVEPDAPELIVDQKRTLVPGIVQIVPPSAGQGGSGMANEPLGRFDNTDYLGFARHGYSAFIKSVESSDPEVAASAAESKYLLNLNKAGTATITITDVFGNSKSCEITVESPQVDPEDVACDTSDIALEQGDEFQLLSRISGSNWKPSMVRFTSANGYIAPIKASPNEDQSPLFTLLGKNVGDTTVKVEYFLGVDYETHEYIMKDLGTIKVHVGPGEAPAVPVESVAISGDVKTAMEVGTVQKLSAEVLPANATDRTIAWSSSDENVLTVGADGLVTAVGNGTASITAKAGGKAATTPDIEVTTPVAGVSLSASELSLFVGGEASELTASVEPVTATNKQMIWSSSDPTVATVDADGTVAPVAAGVTDITVETLDGGFTATCKVTVAQHAEGVTLDKVSLVLIGKVSESLKAVVEPDNATNKNVIWESSAPEVASVDQNGLVTAVSKGSATLTVTTEDGQHAATCAVEVRNPATAIALGAKRLDLTKGQTAQLSAVVSGELPGAVDDDALAWSSSDNEVATVSNVGLVTALKTGTATVTAKLAGGQSATAEVTATSEVFVSNPATEITLDRTAISTRIGERSQFGLKATVTPFDADDASVAWSSTDASVASVDVFGVVTVHRAGSATIMASTVNGLTAACMVNVAAAPLAAVGDGSAAVEADDATALAAVKAKEDEVGPITLVVEPQNALDAVTQAVVDKVVVGTAQVAGVFDIRFADASGDTVSWGEDEASGMLRVKLRIQGDMADLDASTLRVHYLDKKTGVPVEMESWIEDGYLVFLTPHFSDYLVTGQPPVAPEPEDEDDGAALVPIDTQDDNAKKLASTGDPLAFAVVCLALCAVAAGAAAITARKRDDLA